MLLWMNIYRSYWLYISDLHTTIVVQELQCQPCISPSQPLIWQRLKSLVCHLFGSWYHCGLYRNSHSLPQNSTGEAFLKAKLKEEGVTELKSHGKPSGLLWRHYRGLGTTCLSHCMDHLHSWSPHSSNDQCRWFGDIEDFWWLAEQHFCPNLWSLTLSKLHFWHRGQEMGWPYKDIS